MKLQEETLRKESSSLSLNLMGMCACLHFIIDRLLSHAFSFSIFENFKKRVCARCIRYNPSGAYSERCAACNQVWYCSTACATSHATEEHHITCRIYQDLRGLHKDEVAFLRCVVNILVRRHLEMHNRGDHYRAVNFSGKRVSWSDVEVLCDHRESWASAERQAWKRVATVAVGALKASPICSSSREVECMITEDNVLRLISQIESNSFAMLAGNTAVGRCTNKFLYSAFISLINEIILVLYPRASFFNHSCDPTCERIVGDDMILQLKTVREVAAGDEVTISYIDENRPPSARRENLLSSYHFTCCCPRCVMETEGGSAKYSYSRSVNNHARKGAKKRELRAAEKAKVVKMAELQEPNGAGTATTTTIASPTEGNSQTHSVQSSLDEEKEKTSSQLP